METVNNTTDSSGNNNSGSLEQQFRYPEGMKVYGMIIDDRIPSALVRVGLNALSKVDADLLVFLCLETDDIRDRTDWEELASEIRFGNGKQGAYEVRLVNSHEQLVAGGWQLARCQRARPYRRLYWPSPFKAAAPWKLNLSS